MSDGSKYYGDILKFARVTVLGASSIALAPFDPSLQKAAIESLNRRVTINGDDEMKLTELLLEKKVKEVKQDVICLADGSEIPYGVSIWAAGNSPWPVTLNVIAALGEDEQTSANCFFQSPPSCPLFSVLSIFVLLSAV